MKLEEEVIIIIIEIILRANLISFNQITSKTSNKIVNYTNLLLLKLDQRLINNSLPF